MNRFLPLLVLLISLPAVAVADSEKKPSGPVYVEPVRTMDIDEMGGDPTVKNTDQPDPHGEALREKSRAQLEEAGFSFADSLPTLGHRAGVSGKLRATDEIQKRLQSMYVVYLYVAAPEDVIPKEQLGMYISVYGLVDHMTPTEAAIITKPRAQASREHIDSIGWTLENMSALAWMLGHDEQPGVQDKMMSDERLDALLSYLAKSWEGPEVFAKQIKPRPEAEIQQLEDTFYCAHNAVRSAQTGHAEQVPQGFHPMRDGGIVHEKRQALTWALSPGVAWDETDLST